MRKHVDPFVPRPASRVDSASASKTFIKGRVCLEEDCETVLSQYNPGSYCSVHGMDPGEKRRALRNSNGRKKVRNGIPLAQAS